MKYLLIITLLLSAAKECGHSAGIDLLDATSQNWSGGPAATKGTYYKLYLRVSEPVVFQFDSLWADGKRMPLAYIKSLAPADTTLLMANDQEGIRNPMNQQDITHSVPAELPLKTDAAAVLGFLRDGQRGYLPVAKWRVLKPVYYQ
jgi:hypothetical protein